MILARPDRVRQRQPQLCAAAASNPVLFRGCSVQEDPLAKAEEESSDNIPTLRQSVNPKP